MNILLIYKVAIKQLGIKKPIKRHKQPQNQENYIKNWKKNSRKYVQKQYMTPPRT